MNSDFKLLLLHSSLYLLLGSTNAWYRPKPALALLIFLESLVQGRPIEFYPQGIGEVQLGVSQLPEQVVAKALFTAKQVRRGYVAGLLKCFFKYN
jgi:alpha-D-ribose 1-methylphosphonate 5-triphosphate synthase subunit PhnH